MSPDPESSSNDGQTDRRSTIEFFLDLAKASDLWVQRIRAVYVWVSFALMLFLSLLVGFYIPIILNKILINFWVQSVIVVILIAAAGAAWYYFLRRFDEETRLWKERIRRLRENQEKLIVLLEESSE